MTGGWAGAGGQVIEKLAGRCGVIVAGHPGPDAAELFAVADALGWPVLPDPRSSAWEPSEFVVPHVDAIVRSAQAKDRLLPEVVVRLGSQPASRVVNEWLAGSGATEIVVPGPGAWIDPAGTASEVLRVAPRDFISDIAEAVKAEMPARLPDWLAAWQAAASAARNAVATTLADLPSPNEPQIARDVVAGLPAGSTLVVSSSMPIRDVERYAEPRAGVRVLSNRGANGIDGVVSTAVGVALAGGPTALLLGDLAFLHDSNGLIGAAQRGIDLTIVVVDNDGGGIFSFLPQARQLPDDRFETLFGTPHGLDLVALAQAYGVVAQTVDDLSSGVPVDGVRVLLARTDRSANVAIHQTLDTAIASAVDSRPRQ